MAVNNYRQYLLLVGCILAAAALMLNGCVHNKPFRTTSPNVGGLCTTIGERSDCAISTYHTVSNVEDQTVQSPPGTAPSIGYIEFDDQGQLFDRKLAFDVLGMIRNRARKERVSIILFAHGWKHNASSTDSNVASFQKLILETSRLINSNHGADLAPTRVIGVYVGWRGLSARWEPLTSLTFWGRKNTSSTVGDEGLVEIIAELSQIRAENPDRTSLTLSGHSFGGQMLFHATKNLLMKELVERHHAKDPVTGAYQDERAPASNGNKSFQSSLADFTVIVNPAIETLRYSNIQNRLAMRRFDKEQTPIFAVFMSKADEATEILFPLGRSISTAFESYRDVKIPSSDIFIGDRTSQRELDKVALGHHQSSITHVLHRATERPARPKEPGRLPVSPEQEECFQWGAYIRQSTPTGAVVPVNSWVSGSLELERVVRPGMIDPHSPYMVVSVDGGLIKDHNDIWGNEFTSFIADLIRYKGLELECVYGNAESAAGNKRS